MSWTNNRRYRKGLRCDYSKWGPDRPYALGSWPYRSSTENDRPSTRHVDFPTLSFLDLRVLEHGQLDIPRTIDPVPAQVVDFVGDVAEISATATKYF